MREPIHLRLRFPIMRRTLVIAAILLAQSLAGPGYAQEFEVLAGAKNVQLGRIFSLDPVSMSLVVQDSNATRQIWTTRATRFRTGHPDASFFDLMIGQRVAVTFHDSGRLAIADQVTY